MSHVARVEGAAEFKNWSYNDPCADMPTTSLPSVEFSLVPNPATPDIQVVAVFADDTTAGGDTVLECAIRNFVESKPQMTEDGSAPSFEAGELTAVVSTPCDNKSESLRKKVAYSLGPTTKTKTSKKNASVPAMLRKLGTSVSSVCGDTGAGSVEVQLPAALGSKLTGDAVASFVEVCSFCQ